MFKLEAVRVDPQRPESKGFPTSIRYRRGALPRGAAGRLPAGCTCQTRLRSATRRHPVVLGISRIEGVGEDIEVRLVPGGAKGFTATESGHKGVIEADGTIHVAMANGLDLVIHFPDDDGSNGDPGSDSVPGCICEERD